MNRTDHRICCVIITTTIAAILMIVAMGLTLATLGSRADAGETKTEAVAAARLMLTPRAASEPWEYMIATDRIEFYQGERLMLVVDTKANAVLIPNGKSSVEIYMHSMFNGTGEIWPLPGKSCIFHVK